MKIFAFPLLALSTRPHLAALTLGTALMLLAVPARAADTTIIDLSAPADLAAPADSGSAVILNDSGPESDFDFSGGVGSGPDLSGNASMVQIIQQINPATANGAASNGQISYRYAPAAPAAGGH